MFKLRKKTIRASRWAVAITIAAIFGMKRFSVVEMWIAARTIWRAIWAEKGGDASRTLFTRRNLICRRCPVFYKPLLTCGSPFHSHPELGCWCWWGKNKMKSATCWLRTHTMSPGGWPSKLMRRNWSV